MKKWIAGLVVGLFFAVCLFPVWGRWLPSSDRAVESENRALAKWPGSDTRLTEWPQAVEDWFGDHLAFRKEAARL